MKVCWEKDPGSPLTHLALLVPAGSTLDPPGQAGLANLAARALLRGTRRRPRHRFLHEVEAMGATLSARADARHAVFRGVVLTESLRPFLELVAEIFSVPALERRDIDELARLLEGELSTARQDPQYLASRALLNRAFEGTPLAHAPEGRTGQIHRIQAKQVRDFFHAHYLSAGSVLGLAGGEGLVPRPATGSDAILPRSEPRWSGRRSLIVEQSAMETTPLYLAVPGVGEADPDLFALEVANFVFGEDFTSRLMRELRSKRGWTYGVSSSFRQLLPTAAQAGFFSAYLFPSAEFAGPAAAATLRLFEEFGQEGITQEEFERAREALALSAPFRYATAESRLNLKLRELLTGRPYETLEDFLAKLASLTLAQVNRTVRARVRADRIWISAAGSAESLRPVLASLPGFAEPEILSEDQVF